MKTLQFPGDLDEETSAGEYDAAGRLPCRGGLNHLDPLAAGGALERLVGQIARQREDDLIQSGGLLGGVGEGQVRDGRRVEGGGQNSETQGAGWASGDVFGQAAAPPA
jgi:hypothetical protein